MSVELTLTFFVWMRVVTTCTECRPYCWAWSFDSSAWWTQYVNVPPPPPGRMAVRLCDATRGLWYKRGRAKKTYPRCGLNTLNTDAGKTIYGERGSSSYIIYYNPSGFRANWLLIMTKRLRSSIWVFLLTRNYMVCLHITGNSKSIGTPGFLFWMDWYPC